MSSHPGHGILEIMLSWCSFYAYMIFSAEQMMFDIGVLYILRQNYNYWIHESVTIYVLCEDKYVDIEIFSY